jgi:hypothetical protein
MRKSSWNHRIVRREYPDAAPSERVLFAIHEAHYLDGRCTGITQDPVPLVADNLEGLAWALGRMQSALSAPILDYETRAEILPADPRLLGFLEGSA